MPTAKCNSENPPMAQPLGLLGGWSRKAAMPRDARGQVRPGTVSPSETVLLPCSLPQAGGAETFSTHGPAVAVLGNILLEEKLHSHPGIPPPWLVALPGKQTAVQPNVSPPEQPSTLLCWQDSCLPQSTGISSTFLKTK